MQVDNSGTTVVLDAKTTQAIEEGKNRITLLQVEELRLKNLKKTLEGEIIKLEADIDYKEGKVAELRAVIDETVKEHSCLVDSLEELKGIKADTLADFEKREKAVQAKETAAHEKELALDAKETRLNDLVKRTSQDWSTAEKAKDIATEKIKKIDAFLKSL